MPRAAAGVKEKETDEKHTQLQGLKLNSYLSNKEGPCFLIIV